MILEYGDPTHIFVFGKFDTVNIYKKLKINVLPVAIGPMRLPVIQLATHELYVKY